MQPYLLVQWLAGRRVLVVGGGGAPGGCLLCSTPKAAIELVSLTGHPSLEDLAAAGKITWTRRPYQLGDGKDAWLVCACTDDPAVNHAVAAEAEAARIWCVRADDRNESAAWTPAQGTTGDVKIGVLTGDPRRSARLRDSLLARAARSQQAKAPENKGTVAIVGGGPGDPGLITVRGRELLGQADVVVADRLAPRSLLDELPESTEIVDAAKIPYGRAMAQEQINEALISHARAGKFVVRLKGGDPFVFGRGAEEMLACLRAGVPVTVVPGVTSATGVPAAAGIPVTHRGVAQDVHVVSVHVPPGHEQSTVWTGWRWPRARERWC